MTTDGDCTDPGEEICDGVCVNTQEDFDHCGKCFNSCEGMRSICSQGECIFVNPYGAPMPETLWL